MYYYILIIIVGASLAFLMLLSGHPNSWQILEPALKGVTSTDLDKNACLSKNGIWRNNSCMIQDNSEKPITESNSEIPLDFNLKYSFGVNGGSSYDSKSEIFLVDRVCEPVIKITVNLSNYEKGIIWNSVEKNGFFSFGNFTQNCDESGQCVMFNPEEFTTISITAKNKTQSIQYRGSYLL